MAPGPDWPIPPSTYRPDVPADLERVILRCLAEDPADRYPDAESLRDALAASRPPASGMLRRRCSGGSGLNSPHVKDVHLM